MGKLKDFMWVASIPLALVALLVLAQIVKRWPGPAAAPRPVPRALTWHEVTCSPVPGPMALLDGKLQRIPPDESWWLCPDGSIHATDRR